MSDMLRREIENIIEMKRIKTVFQPIISLRDGQVLGHEALSRIIGETNVSNTEEMFQLAATYNRMWDLELLCRVKSLETAYIHIKPPYDKKIFLNVNPKIMHDKKFQEGFTKEYLNKYDITPENIIFEITERDAIKDMESFQSVVEHYKSQNYRIAIDDAGAGYSGLNLISEIYPHYLKLDMKLIRNIYKDSLKHALVKSMVEFSNIANINLIAEGIECREELNVLVDLGVKYGQGYYIQRPNEKFLEIDSGLINYLVELNRKKNHLQGIKLSNIYIDNICKVTKTMSPMTKVEQVYDEFQQKPNIDGVCIVSEERVLGIVTREKLVNRLSGRYGFSLHQKKEITSIMDNEYLEVDYQTPVTTVSYLAMERENSKLYDIIVVTKEGKYHGIVTIKDLLQKTTEIDVLNAKNQNPLSGLPGNMVIENEITQSIMTNKEFTVLYLDIDNFKAFNDVYGFEAGDIVIRILSKVIVKNADKKDFVGHVGGDDFVMIIDHYNWKPVTQNIIRNFMEEVLTLYSYEDRKRGYITTANRHGEIERFPLLSLTISLVNNQFKSYNNEYELTEELARLKKKGKQHRGSVCSFEGVG